MIARKTRLVVVSLALAGAALAGPLGHAGSAHAAVMAKLTDPALTLDGVSPDTMQAASGTSITISCLEGCDANTSVTIGDVTLSGGDVTYDATANTETFTLPDSLQPDIYDLTLSSASGSDTLENAVTVTGAPDIVVSSLSPATVVAGSGATVTIQCNQGCGPNDSVSVGEADITEESVAYDAQTNTETFALPNTVEPGSYPVTVNGPDGRVGDAGTLTVEEPLTLTARIVNATVRPGSVVRMIVHTNAGSGNWSAGIYSAGWRALPHAAIAYQNRGNGDWKVSFTINQHVALGQKQVYIWATLGSQRLSQTLTVCVVR